MNFKNQRKSGSTKHLEFLPEVLEKREMLAGEVDVTVDGLGNLIIKGDGQDSQIEIIESAGTFNVTSPQIATVINGGNGLAGVTGNIQVELRGGADSVLLRNSTTPADLIVHDSAGPTQVTIINSIIGGDLDLSTGKTSRRAPDFKTNIPSSHGTLLFESTVSGSAHISHGDSTVTSYFYRGLARASSVDIVRSNINGDELTINHGATRAIGYDVIGVSNSIYDSSISGDVTITNGAARVRAETSTNYESTSIAVLNQLQDNDYIGGNISITTQQSVTIHEATDGGNATGTKAVFENNNIQGGLEISSGNTAVRGQAANIIGNEVSFSNSTISGDALVTLGTANAITGYVGGSATGNKTTTDISSFGQNLIVQHGDARAAADSSATGNYFGQYNANYGSVIQSDLTITNGDATVFADTAIGNSSRFRNRDGSVGTVAMTNGDARARGNGNVIANQIRLTGFASDILGDISLKNGDGHAVAEGRRATANWISVDEITTSIVVENGDGFARAEGSRADAIGNQIEIGVDSSSVADIAATNGNSRTLAFDEDGSADGNRIELSIREAILTGNVTATNGDAVVRAVGATTDANSNYLNLRFDGALLPSGLIGNIDLTNGNAKATANRAEGNRSSVGGEIEGDVSITNGTAIVFSTPRETGPYASGGSATGNSSSLDRDTTITGNLMINNGDARAQGPTRLSIATAVSHLFFSGVTIDGNVELNSNQAVTSIGDLGRGAGVESIFFDDFSDPTNVSRISGNLTISEGKTRFSAGNYVGSGSAGSSTKLNAVVIDGSFSLATQSGENFLSTIDSEIGGTFTAELLGGDDFVSAENTLFGDVVQILGGSGSDTFEDKGGNTLATGSTLDVELLL